MDETEYARYRAHQVHDPSVAVADLADQTDRTLVFGYLVDRETFHVYLYDGEVNVHVYDHTGTTIRHEASDRWAAADLRPSKRAYVESTDLGFAILMADKDAPLTFTKPHWENEARRRNQWGSFSGRIV
jgi:hypothetical protein